MPHVDAKRTHFGVSFLFSFLSPVPANTPPAQAKAPPSELTPACSSSLLDCISQPGLSLGYPLCRRCPLRTALPHAITVCCAPKPELPTGGSPSQQSKSEQAAPPGAGRKPGNNKAPAVRRMPCFVSWEFPVTCGFIPGSGGFPECSAQHRTVRRRAAVKSAAEEAAHRRSKWRCPDQAGMPSVRWQWLYGARH